MEKKKIEVEIDACTVNRSGQLITPLLHWLQKMKDEGAEIINFYGVGYDVDEFEFSAYQYREETDEEFSKRIERKKRESQRLIDEEKALYFKLKKKFEKNSIS